MLSISLTDHQSTDFDWMPIELDVLPEIGQLGAAIVCSTSPRWLRGGIGLVVGGMLGLLIGSAAGIAAETSNIPLRRKRALSRVLGTIALGLTVTGAAGGAFIGARKPECDVV